CVGYDVGLAVEPGFSVNNRLALSNKAFTYVLAGLAVILTDTPGQREFAAGLGDGAALCPPRDTPAMAAVLARWAHDKTSLGRAGLDHPRRLRAVRTGGRVDALQQRA